MPFAQLVIGPPGSGKSTYCNGMHQFLSALGRKCHVVNLDPANDQTSYPCALDVRSLVTLEEVMGEDGLGPNGGVLYAMEEVERNMDWLEGGLKEFGDDYILFDCPGQVELFTHHSSLRNIFFRLQKIGYRLVCIHLTDSYALTLPSLYISTLLLTLRSMLQLDLPHLNVLSKIDNLSNYPALPFNLDFYTEVQDLEYLLPHLEAEQSGRRLPSEEEDDNHSTTSMPDQISQEEEEEDDDERPTTKFSALNRALTDLITDFGLVSFETLAVENKKSMISLLRTIDRASGYAFGTAEGANDSVWAVAVREGLGTLDVRDVQERWIDRRDEWDEVERNMEVENAEREKREIEKVTGRGGGMEAMQAMHAEEGEEADEDEDMAEFGDMSGVTHSSVKLVRKTG